MSLHQKPCTSSHEGRLKTKSIENIYRSYYVGKTLRMSFTTLTATTITSFVTLSEKCDGMQNMLSSQSRAVWLVMWKDMKWPYLRRNSNQVVTLQSLHGCINSSACPYSVLRNLPLRTAGTTMPGLALEKQFSSMPNDTYTIFLTLPSKC
jgi:hypothetical protein